MFTSNTIQGPTKIQPYPQSTTAAGNQHRSGQTTIIKGVTKMDSQKAGGQQQGQQEFPTFCYTNGTGTVNLSQLATTDDNKTCYITQPFYNYALVNQFQNGIASLAAVDGRIQVVNKPIANTVSSISFKCDVCGSIFSQLGQLNQHKRLHTDGSGVAGSGGTNVTSDTITVVTSGGQNFIQGQNIITETGQSLGQIQIVNADPQQQQGQQHQDVTIIPNTLHQQSQQITITSAPPTTVLQQIVKGSNAKGGKCCQCGGARRKGSKGGRCETCVKNDVYQQRATQIFVDPDGEVKFEEVDHDMVEEVATTADGDGALQIVDDDEDDEDEEMTLTATKASHQTHPVKKRNSTMVSKCNRCNGTGLIYLEASGATANCSNTGGHGQHATVQVKKEKTSGGGSSNNSVDLDAMHPPNDNHSKGDKPFYCNICGGQFSRYSSLWSHRKLHSGEKNHKCVVCGLAFAKSVYLKNHMRIHTGEKPYRCGTCGMQFSQSPHLKNHERTHSGEKPYVCEVCDKGFARHATLWNHRRIHTGEKPYKCEVCGSAFSQAAHLKNHAKVHSGEKPFKCDICSTAFADRFALKRHRGIHDKYGQTEPRASGITKHEIIIEEDYDDPKLMMSHV